jgi:RNA polymerase sigma-54 factor
VLPDVFVVKEGEEYKIVLNDDGLPKLRISPTYRRLLDHKEPGSEETRAYVKDKLRSALWLLKSVDQRQRTIYKVAESIVRHQRAFLDHGISHLRPLVLRDVASDIGMHESTVSRVVANKYMHTPRGVYEMRFFFHSGITSTMGEAISSVTIKGRIRKMIEDEDPSRPLSDSRIADVLGAEGLPLARRTVAKYREELRIAPSNLRKTVH